MERSPLLDTPREGPQDHVVRRIATLLLFFGLIFGLASQQPTHAHASPMPQMDMTAMSQADMAAMPDCMAAMTKDATNKPCKCGLAGCIAMMTWGVSILLPDGSMAPTLIAERGQPDHPTIVAVLHGCSTAPEPEPPSILA